MDYSPRDYYKAVEAIIWAGREAADARLVSASGGNISARLGGSRYCVISCSGSWLARLSVEDFVVLDVENQAVIDGSTKPSSEYKVHTMTYAARPDVRAVVHLHPQWTVLARALDIATQPLTLDHFSYLGEIRYVPLSPNGSDQLGQDVAAAAANGSDVIVLDHHGSACLGDDIAMAYRRSLNLEEAARASVITSLAGHSPINFPAELARPHA